MIVHESPSSLRSAIVALEAELRAAVAAKESALEALRKREAEALDAMSDCDEWRAIAHEGARVVGDNALVREHSHAGLASVHDWAESVPTDLVATCAACGAKARIAEARSRRWHVTGVLNELDTFCSACLTKPVSW